MIEHLEHEKRSLSDALEVAKKSVKTVQSSSSDLTVELAKVQEELLLEQEKVIIHSCMREVLETITLMFICDLGTNTVRSK